LHGILDLLSLFMLTMMHWFYFSPWYTASLASHGIFFWNLKTIPFEI
jgi:hypothetical protein